jgi:chromosome partitioning protein
MIRALRLSNQVVEEVKMHFQQMTFDTIIHRNTKLGEAPSFGHLPLLRTMFSSKGATNYLNLCTGKYFRRTSLQK